ncbi:MAG: (2Fe-2S) ferredoxin domain-containing protein [Leptolyngbya sp. BL-A-14]
MSKKELRSTLSLEGRCLGLVFKDGRPKWLQLLTANGEHTVKLAKDVRASIGADLVPGAWIQVWGEQKLGRELGDASFKAYKVKVAAPGKPEELPTPAESRPTTSGKILVCQKSDCMKRGGKAVCHALEAALSNRQLKDVKIQGTGCMKHCKAGPNIVFMPDKTRYSRVSAQDVDALVDEHFPRAPIQATNSQRNSGAV